MKVDYGIMARFGRIGFKNTRSGYDFRIKYEHKSIKLTRAVILI